MAEGLINNKHERRDHTRKGICEFNYHFEQYYEKDQEDYMDLLVPALM